MARSRSRSTKAPVVPASSSEKHSWAFKARFRARGFGWRSQPAITRVKEAVSEIKLVARTDMPLAAEGAVLLIERLSPALEQVDSSSGAIGSAVNRALVDLADILVLAPVDAGVGNAWLERLWEAKEADQMPYLEELLGLWGELCVTRELASAWADRLMPLAREAVSQPDGRLVHLDELMATLSALHHAGRYDDIIALLAGETFWRCKRWEVMARAAMGDVDGALALAESLRGRWTNAWDLASVCERILLDAGREDEALARYAVAASASTTHIAHYRTIARKYPNKSPEALLGLLVASTPGDGGKWFATAKELGLLDKALSLARGGGTDPMTLARAARDHADKQPSFALEAGLLALDGIASGMLGEPTSDDVWMAFDAAERAARGLGKVDRLIEGLRGILAASPGRPDHLVGRMLGPEAADTQTYWQTIAARRARRLPSLAPSQRPQKRRR